jgi:hypothetical protein
VGSLYGKAWRRVRARRTSRPLRDELLWHDVYERYIGSLPYPRPGDTRDELVERQLRFLRPMAWPMLQARCPGSFGVWAKETDPHEDLVSLVHELAAVGVLGLLVAAQRYRPRNGSFGNYADYYARKYMRL